MVDEEAVLDVEDNEEADDEAFVTYEIAAYPADYTLSVLDEMWRHGDIMVPSFQRKFVWTIKQASLLIESLLMGLPVPQAFFYVESDSRNLVIDGLQRTMSIVYFFSGYFGDESYQGKKTVFRLTGLNEKSPYNKKTYDDLTDADKRKLRSRVLRVINIKQIGPKDDNTSAYHIFERLNTGGTPLTAQEIRHCVFHGQFVDMLSELNKDAHWRKILGKAALDKHQKDVELILRVFAIATRGDAYEKPMKEFLNRAMKAHKDGETTAVQRFVQRFPAVCQRIVEDLGERPFNIKARINSSALDAVMGALIASDSIPSNLKERYAALLGDAEFVDTLSVSTSDTAVVKKRIGAVRRHLFE